MIFRTHLAFAFLLGLFFYKYLSLSEWWWFFPVVLISAGFPDVDNPDSKYGKRLGWVSKILAFLFRHRGVFHSVVFGGVLGYILWQAFGKIIGIGFWVGFFSHLVLDGFTVKGINLIYPFKQLRLSGFVRSGGKLESILFYCILGIDVLMLVKFLS